MDARRGPVTARTLRTRTHEHRGEKQRLPANGIKFRPGDVYRRGVSAAANRYQLALPDKLAQPSLSETKLVQLSGGSHSAIS